MINADGTEEWWLNDVRSSEHVLAQYRESLAKKNAAAQRD